MSFGKKLVGLSTIVLLVSWFFLHIDDRMQGDQSSVVRLFISVLFPVLVLLRPKPDDPSLDATQIVEWRLNLLAIIGTVSSIALGIVYEIRFFEWLGMLMLVYACLRWILPHRYHRDLLLALFLFYFFHPMPSQIFEPMQRAMRTWSVDGAEWLLHAGNVRVWADQFDLFTGYQTFSVPNACSGMRTGVTVVLVALGVGILYRLRWYSLLLFTFLGFLQVLVLNILRISLMVILADRFEYEVAVTFLHDTLNVFLLVSVILIQLEIMLWRKLARNRREYQTAVSEGEAEPKEIATRFPRFWRLVFTWWWLGLLVVVTILGSIYMDYKRRSFHRAEMIWGVAEGLIDIDLPRAEMALLEILELNPDKVDFHNEYIRVLLMQEKYDQALVAIDVRRKLGEGLEKGVILESWALVGLGRIDEAMALVEELPETSFEKPGIAMVVAEFSALHDDPDAVAENIVKAAVWSPMQSRARALFPYLASRQKWSAIATSDNLSPHVRSSYAHIAIRAHLAVRDYARAGEELEAALERWPDEKLFMNEVFRLAVMRRDAHWEQVFVRMFREGLADMTATELARYLDTVGQLDRADLLWLAYDHLYLKDPEHPALLYAPAVGGGRMAPVSLS